LRLAAHQIIKLWPAVFPQVHDFAIEHGIMADGSTAAGGLTVSVDFLFRLRELILADIAEAEFIELTVSQLVQSINHVVVTAFKSSINSGRLQYH
jgi:hypothetical protein